MFNFIKPVVQVPVWSLDMALNNETIVGQDLVAWVMCGIVHVPRNEVCHPPVHVGLHPLLRLIYTLVRTEGTCLLQKYLLYMHLLYVCLLSNVDQSCTHLVCLCTSEGIGYTPWHKSAVVSLDSVWAFKPLQIRLA